MSCVKSPHASTRSPEEGLAFATQRLSGMPTTAWAMATPPSIQVERWPKDKLSRHVEFPDEVVCVIRPFPPERAGPFRPALSLGRHDHPAARQQHQSAGIHCRISRESLELNESAQAQILEQVERCRPW